LLLRMMAGGRRGMGKGFGRGICSMGMDDCSASRAVIIVSVMVRLLIIPVR
jgi:hypothetical protein